MPVGKWALRKAGLMSEARQTRWWGLTWTQGPGAEGLVGWRRNLSRGWRELGWERVASGLAGPREGRQQGGVMGGAVGRM